MAPVSKPRASDAKSAAKPKETKSSSKSSETSKKSKESKPANAAAAAKPKKPANASNIAKTKKPASAAKTAKPPKAANPTKIAKPAKAAKSAKIKNTKAVKDAVMKDVKNAKASKSTKDAKASKDIVKKSVKIAKPAKDIKDAKGTKAGKGAKPSKNFAALKGLRRVKSGRVEKKKMSKPRNYELVSGIYRFSKNRMFHKKAKYKFVGQKHEKAKKPKKPTHIVKPIGGEKNGGKRIVLLKKRRNYYPTVKKINRHPPKKSFKDHKRYTRKTLRPGKVCILLAGRHKGKRVVLLKILKSGLLLVTGPFVINGCPLRRISQNYVIATSTKLDLSGVKVPEHIKDGYFKRRKPKRAKKEEGNIFATKKEGYKASHRRKTDQKAVDKQIMRAISRHPEKSLMRKYLSSMFGLKKTQYPHRMKY